MEITVDHSIMKEGQKEGQKEDQKGVRKRVRNTKKIGKQELRRDGALTGILGVHLASPRHARHPDERVVHGDADQGEAGRRSVERPRHA